VRCRLYLEGRRGCVRLVALQGHALEVLLQVEIGGFSMGLPEWLWGPCRLQSLPECGCCTW
jgi:hypothetical protein